MEAIPAPVVVEVEVVPESADPVAKKIRNLLKKVRLFLSLSLVSRSLFFLSSS